MQQLYSPNKSRRLIQDITPNTTGDVDTRSTLVRHQSIGHLNAGYVSSRNEGVTHIKRAGVKRGSLLDNITRIPPLGSFPDYRNGTKSIGRIVLACKSAAITLKATTVSTYASIVYAFKGIEWVPTKYSASKGVHVDWRTNAFKGSGIALPAIAVIGGLTFLAMAQSYPTDTGSGTTKKPGTVQISPASATILNGSNKTTPSFSTNMTNNTARSSQAQSSTPATATTPSATPTATSDIPSSAASMPIVSNPDTTQPTMPTIETPVDIPPVVTPIDLPVEETPDPTPTNPVTDIVDQSMQQVTSVLDPIL